MTKIGRVYQGSGILKKTFTFLSEMFSNVSSSQEKKEADIDIENHDEDDDDDFFNDQIFLDVVVELEKLINENSQQEKEIDIVIEVDVAVAEQAQQVILELETPVIEVRELGYVPNVDFSDAELATAFTNYLATKKLSRENIKKSC
ncbi:conserved hypothetical protein [Ricinus communis]|uniref:Uncharacterized protein n=1 Tax=Ricinus communis TaxID=3988 RepID=B9SL21_RICCO|nr:conserved hypothetical protein [Ricinus communis]